MVSFESGSESMRISRAVEAECMGSMFHPLSRTSSKRWFVRFACLVERWLVERPHVAPLPCVEYLLLHDRALVPAEQNRFAGTVWREAVVVSGRCSWMIMNHLCLEFSGVDNTA